MMLHPQPRPTFEPPRAGATRGVWNAWYAILRRTRLPIPPAPKWLTPPNVTWESVAVVLIPTYAWWKLGKAFTARWTGAAYVASTVVAILCMGWTAAGLAAGVMLTLHGLGIAEYFYSGALWPRPNHRYARYVGVTLILAVVYGYGSHLLLTRVVFPVEADGRVVLINAMSRPESAVQGEILLYHARRWQVGHFRLPEGSYVGQVLARTGDVVRFDATAFSVNGQSYPRRPAMPKGGELKVPANHLFIWPAEFRRDFTEEVAARDFAEKSAMVSVNELIGRPYRRWFFREQSHEPLR